MGNIETEYPDLTRRSAFGHQALDVFEQEARFGKGRFELNRESSSWEDL